MRSQVSASVLGTLAEMARFRPIDGSLDDLLWGLCREVAEGLRLPDCVLYLRDRAGGRRLEQRAAWGPKNPRQREILDPIEIPVGCGIVGSVAAEGRPQRIIDTTLDPRYIVDDEFRLSELAVPILSGGEVIGVFDSEHPEKGYFGQEDMDALTVLLSLRSDRIGELWKSELQDERVPTFQHVENGLGQLLARLGGGRSELDRQEALGRIHHELRTPLNAILGYGELLATGDLGGFAEREALEGVLRNGRRLEDRLLKLLAMPEFFLLEGESEVALSTTDIVPLLRDVATTVGPPVDGVALVLDLPAELELRTHPKSLASIVRILLDNALQSTTSGLVALRAGSREGRPTWVEVEDTGCGIPKEELGRIFDLFHQVPRNGLRQERSGLGLGLTIVRRLADRLGYELDVESEVGRGAVFRLGLTGSVARPEG